jgi:hypothetical protein
VRDLAIDEGNEGYIMERVARIPPGSRASKKTSMSRSEVARGRQKE